MTRIRHIRRLAAALAGLAGALLAFTGAAPAAFASGPPPRPPGWPPLPPGWNKHPPPPVQVRTIVIGGIPGWQIALIAIAAALLAATVAVITDRALVARQTAAASRAVKLAAQPGEPAPIHSST